MSGVLFNYLSQEKIGLPNTLWIFFACNVAGAICTLLIDETKGMDADARDFEESMEAGLYSNGTVLLQKSSLHRNGSFAEHV